MGNNTPAKATARDGNNTNSDLITSHIMIFTPIPASPRAINMSMFESVLFETHKDNTPESSNEGGRTNIF